MATHAVTKAAARERATRTLWQGLGLDVLVAVAAAVLAWLPNADVTSGDAWLVLGALLIKTVLQAAASYVLRLKALPAHEEATATTIGHVEAYTRLDDEAGVIDRGLANLVAAIVLGGLILWLLIELIELIAK